MADKGDTTSKITVGDIGRDLSGNIAGRDIIANQMNQPPPADKDKALVELRQLLANIQQQLAEIATQQDVLKEVSPDAPFAIQGTEATVKDTVEKVEAGLESETARSAQTSLTRAAHWLGDILDSVRTVAEKADQVGNAVNPIAQKLMPLLESMGRVLWLIKFWV